MTIALSPSYNRTVAIVLSHCRHRTIALSQSYYRIVVIVFSHCRPYCRTVVIVLLHYRIVALWIFMCNHDGFTVFRNFPVYN
ncbi:hypothetical protein DPMN_020269 [Dreissena polymorpha]|uniref:Uncharacterized protein n=1 Tax=Dreissena polymorpha TaxID=45954 RepID=A0A9D4NKT6_DREPO|nr:hypothetical protein DPMN_020269 [Dreissena polymorpha]